MTMLATTLDSQDSIPVLDDTNTVTGSDAANASSINTAIYGSFSLAGTEFALSAQSIQEVVNEPDSYSPIPLTPDYILGVFNLRGSIVPVIDLRHLFDLQSEDYDGCSGKCEARKVAIVEYGELCLGLLFDHTGEVFNGNEVEQCLFERRGDSDAQQVIAGVFKMSNSQRIVQILDVHAMLKLDKVPHSANNAGRQSLKHRGKRHQCISFKVGKSCCALEIDSIREIVNIGHIDNKVLAGECCIGAIDIRGDTVPIVNFSRLLGYDDSSVDDLCESDSTRVIVMSFQNSLVGFLVDSIENIISYFLDELIDFPVLVDRKKTLFKGCVAATDNANHTIVLNHEDILSRDELATITRGHSQLFSDMAEKAQVDKKSKNESRTLMLFSLEKRYALDISDVKEVIEYPEELVQTPDMADHIRGMANLRGELVAVIDTRKLYKIDSADSCSGGAKVLIYEKTGVKHGLVVDSVDSIVPLNRAEVVAIPEIATHSSNKVVQADVTEAIMINHGDSQETVCILDLDALSQRLAA